MNPQATKREYKAFPQNVQPKKATNAQDSFSHEPIRRPVFATPRTEKGWN